MDKRRYRLKMWMDRERSDQVMGIFIRNVARYIQRSMGDEALDQLLNDSGLTREVLSPNFANEWRSSAELNAALGAAASLTKDPGIGRRVGEQTFYDLPDAHPFLQGAGSVTAAVVEGVALGNRSRINNPFEVVEATNNSVTIGGHGSSDGSVSCGIAAGFWSLIPSLFNAVGSVVEPRCENRGDSYCEYHVRWEFPTTPRPGQGLVVEDRRESLVRRYEQMHAMATQFANAANLADLLPVIAAQAASVVSAPFAIVAVQPAAEVGLWNIAGYGISKKRAEQIVASYSETGSLPTDAAYIASSIRPSEHGYGYALAIQQEGIDFRAYDQRMLDAFIGFAAPSIEAAQAMEAAYLERDTARALLRLSHSLANLSDDEEIAKQVAQAVPYVVPCDETSVVRWNADDGTMSVMSSWPRTAPAELETFRVDPLGGTWELVTKRRPVVITPATASASTKDYVTERVVSHIVAVPIVVQDEVFGMVTAGLKGREQAFNTNQIADRLSGLADQASISFSNAMLLKSVKYQATHDTLTGLPNRTVMERSLGDAIDGISNAHSFVTAMFIDLDGFKEVNDIYGHLVGDSVLSVVAERMESHFRDVGVVGRLGGDEFLAVLRGPGQAAQSANIAQELLDALVKPISVGGLTLQIGASIGIASTNNPKGDKVSLLRSADQAMYTAKQNGRNNWLIVNQDHLHS